MRRSQILGTTAVALALISGAGYAGVAAAADTSASTTALPELVVHARSRGEKLLDAPLSVQSFSAAKLAADGIDNLSTLQYESGFTFNSQGASYSGGGREFPTLIFRGMATDLSSFVGGSSGALFVDGIYISGGAASVTLADASSVEVLKGPQNVYFGKNTFGGAVNIITSNPSEDYHAKATVGYSSKGSYDDVFTAEGAIIPGLLTGRVTGELYHQGKQYTSADGGPLGEQDTKGITVVLYATPTPDIWLRTRFHYSVDADSEAAEGYLDGATYGTSCPGMTHPYFCSGYIPTLATISPQSVLSGTMVPGSLEAAIKSNSYNQLDLGKVPTPNGAGLARTNLQGSVAGGIKLPYDTTFQFSAGYNQQLSDDVNNANHEPIPGGGDFWTSTATINRDFEADARIITSANQPLRATIGANYFQSASFISQGSYYFGPYGGGTSPFIDETDKTVAAYGGLEYDILHNLTLDGEIRYQRSTITDLEQGQTFSHSTTHALPRVILKYNPFKDTNIYLSYSEGVQPPQAQASYITALAESKSGPSAPNTYLLQALAGYGITGPWTTDPTVRVWELGWKQSLFDHRANFSVDIFDQFWDNAQVQTDIFDPTSCKTTPGGSYPDNTYPNCPLGSTGKAPITAANIHTTGVEFDGNARITSKLTAHATFNWNHAIRTNYQDSTYGAAFTSGTVPSQNGLLTSLVPEFSGEFDATYKDHLVGPYDWYAHGVVTYTGPTYADDNNIAETNGYYRVNLAAGVTKGNITFEAFINNALDDKSWDMAVRFPSPYHFYSEAYQGVIVQAPNPRDFGFKITAKY